MIPMTKGKQSKINSSSGPADPCCGGAKKVELSIQGRVATGAAGGVALGVGVASIRGGSIGGALSKSP